MSLKKRYLVGMVTNLGAFGVRTLINLALIPIIISTLGPDIYGVYLLLLTLVEVLVDLIMGSSAALALRLGETLTQPEDHAMTLRLGWWVHVTVAGTLLLLSGLVGPWAVKVGLQVPPFLQPAVPLLILLTTLEGCFYLLSSVFRVLLGAHTRFGVSNVIDTVIAIVANGCTLAMALAHQPLVNIVAVRAFCALLGFGVFVWVCRPQWVGVGNWSPGLITRPHLAQFVKVATPSTLLMVCSVLSSRTDGLIINYTMSLSAVAAYGIVQRIYGQAMALGIRLTGGQTPLIIRLYNDGRMDDLYKLFIRLSQGLCFMSAFLCVWLTWYYPELFEFLSHGKLDVAPTLPVVFTLIPFVITLITTTPANGFLYAKNMVGQQFKWVLVGAIINLAISLGLVGKLGMLALALGNTCSMVIARQLYETPTACRLMGLPYGHYLKQVYGLTVLPVAVAFGLFWLLDPLTVQAKVPLIVRFLGGGALVGSISVAVWAWIIVPVEERKQWLARIKLKPGKTIAG
jgi:O-antigen/teichoic acid export membrane protein